MVGMGMGMAHPEFSYYIFYTPNGVRRAHVKKHAKRTRVHPALCVRWGLGEMYLGKKTRLQTDRHALSYGSDKDRPGHVPRARFRGVKRTVPIPDSEE